ncbi:MAG: glycosyltransferase [Pseudomonadota bacterium]
MTRSPARPVVAFVIEALTVGGAEQMLVAMANRFASRGWTVHLICLTTAGELAPRLDDRVHFEVIGKRPGFDWRLALRLRRRLTAIDPVAINSHLWTANLWTRVALPFSRHRIVVTEHSRDTWKPRHYRVIDRVLARWTHRLVAVSHDTRDFYVNEIGIPAALTTVINNGIDTAQFAGGTATAFRAEWAPNGELLIGTVGRLVPAKNHARLIEATALLDVTIDDFKVLIVGDGPLRSEIENAVQAHGVAHRVHLLGARRDIADVLSALDIFVLSSDREGHPLTALEAQAAGTPVVLTDAGGSQDAIASDGTDTGGLLVERSAAALAECIASLARDTAEREQMAAVAKRVASTAFDLDAMVARYESCFSTAAG